MDASAFRYTRSVMTTPRTPGTPLTRAIGLTQATAIVVGTVIGTSIFVQPSEITRDVPTITGILVAWSLAGGLTFLGALVCAELASAFPETGGVYVFLREAFSTRVAGLKRNASDAWNTSDAGKSCFTKPPPKWPT